MSYNDNVEDIDDVDYNGQFDMGSETPHPLPENDGNRDQLQQSEDESYPPTSAPKPLPVVEYETCFIDPQQAEELLTLNTSNRPMNKAHVSFLAEQMRTNSWQFAGDPIRISESGVLLDGQHRLAAIVESGTTQLILILRNLPNETFHVMDTGRMRKSGDVVAIAGHKNAALLASVARSIVNYQRGVIGNTLTNSGRVVGKVVTNKEILEFIDTIDLQPYILTAMKWYRQCNYLSNSEYAFFYFVFSEKSETDAVQFFDSFASGANLSLESPILALRKKIEQYKHNRVSISSKEKVYMLFKVWNAYRTGAKMVHIHIQNKAGDQLPPLK